MSDPSGNENDQSLLRRLNALRSSSVQLDYDDNPNKQHHSPQDFEQYDTELAARFRKLQNRDAGVINGSSSQNKEEDRDKFLLLKDFSVPEISSSSSNNEDDIAAEIEELVRDFEQEEAAEWAFDAKTDDEEKKEIRMLLREARDVLADSSAEDNDEKERRRLLQDAAAAVVEVENNNEYGGGGGGGGGGGDADSNVASSRQQQQMKDRRTQPPEKRDEDEEAEEILSKLLGEIDLENHHQPPPPPPNDDDDNDDDDGHLPMSSLPDVPTSSLPNVVSLPSAPTIPPVKTKATRQKKQQQQRRHENNNTQIDQSSWCVICCMDAAVKCLGCEADVYCVRCWRECHTGEDSGWEVRRHRWVGIAGGGG